VHIFVGQFEVKNELSETLFKTGNVELGVAQIEDGIFKCLYLSPLEGRSPERGRQAVFK
jgi:hypothetical protein